MKQSDKLRQNIRDTREQKKLTQEELAENWNDNLWGPNIVIALTDKGLESEILRLRQMLADKEEIIKVKEQENESLRQQIRQQEKIITLLEQ